MQCLKNIAEGDILIYRITVCRGNAPSCKSKRASEFRSPGRGISGEDNFSSQARKNRRQSLVRRVSDDPGAAQEKSMKTKLLSYSFFRGQTKKCGRTAFAPYCLRVQHRGSSLTRRVGLCPTPCWGAAPVPARATAPWTAECASRFGLLLCAALSLFNTAPVRSADGCWGRCA